MGIVGCGLGWDRELNYHQLLQGLTVASCSTVYDASLHSLLLLCKMYNVHSIISHLGGLGVGLFCDFHVSLLCIFWVFCICLLWIFISVCVFYVCT